MERLWLKNYPPNVPADLPPLDKSLIQLFETACKEFKNKTAFVSFGQKMSYKELRQKSLQLAGYLQSQGFIKGDVIVIQLPNLLQYPVSFWSAMLSGLTVINMSPLNTAEEMLGPLQETSAKGIILLSKNLTALKKIYTKTQLQLAIVTGPGDLLDFPKKQIINTASHFQTFYSSLFFKKALFSFQKKREERKESQSDSSQNKKGPSPALIHQKTVSFKKALQKGSKTKAKIQERGFKETFLIQYTGGTTGLSKGACLSQKNILSNLKQCEIWMLSHLQKRKEKALAALPLYHIFAFLVNGLVFFFSGFANVLVANPRRISSLIKVMSQQKITVGTGLNTLFKALLAQPQFKKLDFSKWRLFVAGGMSLELSVIRQWQSATNSRLVEGYGLTEASPVLSCNRLDQPAEGFAGLPLSSTQIRIVDDQGRELGINQEGELEARGPQVMEGYYKQDEETQKALSPEGWLKTGDIAKINSEGLIQIIDRKKDMINVSGFKVFPNEVEAVLMSFDKVKEAVAAPGKNKKGNEVVKAFIVPKKEPISERELKERCKKQLAPYKIPKQIVFVQNIPKTIAGKPIRRLFKNK